MTLKKKHKFNLITLSVPDQLDIYSSKLEKISQDIAESLNDLILLRSEIAIDIEILKKATR